MHKEHFINELKQKSELISEDFSSIEVLKESIKPSIMKLHKKINISKNEINQHIIDALNSDNGYELLTDIETATFI